MTDVSGIVRDTQGNALAGLQVTIKYKLPLVGSSGGAAVGNTRVFTTSGTGLLEMDGLEPGYYDISISVPTSSAGVYPTILQEGDLTVLAQAEQSLESAISTTFGAITPTVLQQALDAAADAEASAARVDLGALDDAVAATEADATQTALDRIATAADRVQTGLDVDSAKAALDAGLASIAGITVAADQGVYATGADTYATFALGSLSRTFLANTTAAGYRSTLGLGTAAVADLIDEDSFATNSATRPPSQQSTKAYVDSRPMWGYVSAPTAISTNTNMTFTHGLGVAPSVIAVDAICKTAGRGFSVGDVIYDVESIDGAFASRSILKFVQVGNTTTVRVNVGAGLFILHADNSIATATATFDLIVKAKA